MLETRAPGFSDPKRPRKRATIRFRGRNLISACSHHHIEVSRINNCRGSRRLESKCCGPVISSLNKPELRLNRASVDRIGPSGHPTGPDRRIFQIGHDSPGRWRVGGSCTGSDRYGHQAPNGENGAERGMDSANPCPRRISVYLDQKFHNHRAPSWWVMSRSLLQFVEPTLLRSDVTWRRLPLQGLVDLC